MADYESSSQSGQSLLMRVTYSQSIAGNYSNVRLRQYQVVDGGNWIEDTNWRFISRIDGVEVNDEKIHIRVSSTTKISDETRRVYHDADGTKSVDCYAYSRTSVDGNFYKIVDETITLKTIPRKTTPDWSGNFTAGSAKTIDLDRASSSFDHVVTYTFQGASGTISSSAGSSVSWTPPMSLLNQIPDTTSASGTIKVVTKSGSTTVGTASKTFTLVAGAGVTPTVNSVTWTDDNPSTASNIGAFVQNASRIRGTVSSTGAYGSSIVKERFTIGSTEVPEGTAVTIAQAGTVAAGGKATDSRNRVDTKSVPFSVLAYSPPIPTTFEAQRANSAGSPEDAGKYLRVDLTAAAHSLVVSGAQKNALKIVVKTRQNGASGWTTRNTITPGLSYNSHFVVGGGGIYLTTNSYDVRVELSDEAGVVHLAETRVSVGEITLDLNGNKVGIGGYHRDGALDVNGDTFIRGDLNAEGAVNADGDVTGVSSIFSQMYANNYYSEGLIVAGRALRGNSGTRDWLEANFFTYDGLKFWDTAEKREYVYLNGAWRGAVTDLSGYKLSGFTGPVEARYNNGVVDISGGNIRGVAIYNATLADFMENIPSWLRPKDINRWGSAWANGLPGLIVFRPDGTVGIANRTSVNWGPTTPIQFTATYVL